MKPYILILIIGVLTHKTFSQEKACVTDLRDDKNYKTIQIGNLSVMAENLNYKSEKGSWCYEDEQKNCNINGRLYDWEAAKQSCFPGWHLPTLEEFEQLINNVGGESGAVFKNLIFDGTSGFNAMMSGIRNSEGAYNYLEDRVNFWSSTNFDAQNAIGLNLNGNNMGAGIGSNRKGNAYSVRCIKDR